MAPLILPIKKYWFGMIADGKKKEEYRQINLYWLQRLINTSNYPSEEKGDDRKILRDILFDIKELNLPPEEVIEAYYCKIKQWFIVELRNGYGSNVPFIKFNPGVIKIGYPNPEWCPPETDLRIPVFIIPIHEIIDRFHPR